MRDKKNQSNIDLSDATNYPNGRIKNNTGGGDGTPINEEVYGDFHEMKDKLMRLAGIAHNNLPDNELNGYQFIEALIHLANKNNFTINLLKVGVQIRVTLKLGKLLNEEQFEGYAPQDFNSSNTSSIRGSDNVSKNVVVVGDIKTGESVRIINRTNDVVLVRLITAVNVDSVNTSLGFLKAASVTETITGSINNKAVTPVSFSQSTRAYLNGSPSGGFLANSSRNGLLSAAQYNIIANLGQNKVRNVGAVLGIDIASSAGQKPVSGDAISAFQVNGDGTQITVNMKNSMGNNNYFVRLHIRSRGAVGLDNNIFAPSYRINSPNQIVINIQESSSFQILDFHFEAVKI